MKVIILISFLIFSIFLSQASIKSVFSPERAKRTELALQTAVDVKEINFDKQSLVSGCPMPVEPREDVCHDDSSTIVSTVSTETKDPGLIFHYNVTGGTVTGQGAFVVWDLTGTKPGDYSITVQIENSQGILGKSLSKNISYSECSCLRPPPPCDCAVIKIKSSREKAVRNEEILFETELSGGDQRDPVFNWTVTGGKIISGQGTPKITVKATGEKGKSLESSVDIGGLCANCRTEATLSLPIVN